MRLRILLVLLTFSAALAAAAWFVLHRRGIEPAMDRPPMPGPSPTPPLPPQAQATREATPPEPPTPPQATPPPEVPMAPTAKPRDTTASGAWYGRVVDSVTHSPLRDAIVVIPDRLEVARLDIEDDFASSGEACYSLDRVHPDSDFHTDGDGRFEIPEARVPPRSDGIKFGVHLGDSTPAQILIVRAMGFGSTIFDPIWLGRDREHPLEIPVDRAGVLRGKLKIGPGDSTRTWSLRLIAHAYEAVRPQDQSIDNVLMQSVGVEQTFDDEGNLTIESLPPGVPFTAMLWSTSGKRLRDPNSLVLEPGKTTTREWRFGSGSRIRGHLVDQDGEPVPSQELWLTQRGLYLERGAERATFYTSDKEKIADSTTSGTDGGFEFAGIAPGKWWIGISATYHYWDISEVDARAIPPIAQRVEVPDGATTIEITIRVHRGLFITGRLVDPEGHAASGFIRAWSHEPGLVAAEHAQPRDDGSFTLGPLEPGDYEVDGEPSAFKDEGTTLAPSKPLVVAAGRSDVSIELQRGGTIRPRAVRGATGEVAAAAFCLAASKDPHVLYETGRFEPRDVSQFAGLAPDVYELAAVTSDGMIGSRSAITLSPGQILEDVRVIVEPGAKLVLHYVGESPDHAQVSIWQGATYFGGDGIHAGTSTTCVAPRGKVTVKWTVGKDHFKEEVTLAVGEMRELSWPRPK